MTEAAPIAPTRVPRLPRGVRLRFDEVRGHWMLLAPERAFKIDDTAAEVLKLVDGERDVAAVIVAVAEKFAEDPATIAADVEEMLADLAAKRVLDL